MDQDGNLYEFKYSKYSDFVDNLEPFILEDFGTPIYNIIYSVYTFEEDFIIIQKL